MKRELDRCAGALDVLALLRETLELESLEAGDESARDAFDTALSHVAALDVEYRRRRDAHHPDHESRLFLIMDGDIRPLTAERYVALVTGKATAPELAGRRVRLADWYVRRQMAPGEVVNETYGWLVFNEQGRVDWHAAHAIEDDAAPGDAERARLQALLAGMPASKDGH